MRNLLPFRLMPKTVKILSIDGGGIRGIIPAILLSDLHGRMEKKRKSRPFCSIFDLMAGTSTGSLIALALAAPGENQGGTGYTDKPLLSIGEIIDLYDLRGTEIFPRRIFAQFQTMRQAFSEKYDSGSFEQVLNETFGDRTIQDALTNVLVTSFDIERGYPLIIKKRPGRHAHEDPDFFMRDAARGSSAAPTYFEPVQVKPVNQDEVYSLIDGSVFASNPAMSAYVEARKIFPFARKFIILSLGTGASARRYTYDMIKSWGFIDWVLPSNGVPMALIMGKGQSESVNYQLHHLPEVEYYRFDPDLSGCSEDMDDAGDKNMACLRDSALKLIAEKSEILDKLAALL